jgi:hypothetical protein
MALALRTMVIPTAANDTMYSYAGPRPRREWVVHLQVRWVGPVLGVGRGRWGRERECTCPCALGDLLLAGTARLLASRRSFAGPQAIVISMGPLSSPGFSTGPARGAHGSQCLVAACCKTRLDLCQAAL